ncbi:hypothetical protein ALC60_13455 [Trachymyrmex zeteki]|uniref:USP domain-containing protein n=1 Tax=Mycetomoellerius zeteki TaxID=64791 RepID=A0A151WI52_9HYME|nr:hypothetical protein ALC60_13455 [Trachymyrmex zeteki]
MIESVITDKRYAASIVLHKNDTTLNSVPKILRINEKNYVIAGLVSHQQYASNENDGHYTAYIYDTIRWYMYNDMLIKRRMATDEEKIAPHIIIYTAKNT